MEWIMVPRELHNLVEFLRTEQACAESAKFELDRAEEHVRALKTHIKVKECSVLDITKDIEMFIREIPEAEEKKSIIEEFDLDDLFPCE
jgi:hypothetical protein